VHFGLGPDERLGLGVVCLDEGIDVGHQLLPAVERYAGERFGGQDREPDFDLVESGRFCWREVEIDVGMCQSLRALHR
jgi:hypothetical protein